MTSTPPDDGDHPGIEPTTDPASDADVVRAYCDAWVAGDTATVVSLYHPELTLVWPGEHHLAGRHVGLDAAIDALLRLQVITNRRPAEIVDITVQATSIDVRVREHWTAREPSDMEADTGTAPNTDPVDVDRTLHYTVVDRKLHTCRITESDQHLVDTWIEQHAVS